MKFKDYYEILGVTQAATQEDIKKAYRKLAHQYHPDVSKDPAGENKFKEIGEAYATLKDSEKRAAYDELGRHPVGEDFRPPPNWGGQHGTQGYSFDGVDLSDLFASFSKGRQGTQHQGRSMPITGQDYELAVQISLEEAFNGKTVDLDFTVPEYDSNGQLRRVPHTFKARIPKGVSNGQKLLLRGKGGKGANGGTDGNIYLNISFISHRLFRVVDSDLYVDLPLTVSEAALGVNVKVPTLDGIVNLKVPAGITNDQKLRMGKHGMIRHNHERGDFYAVIKIVVPAKLSDKERELFKELAKVSTFNPREHFDLE